MVTVFMQGDYNDIHSLSKLHSRIHIYARPSNSCDLVACKTGNLLAQQFPTTPTITTNPPLAFPPMRSVMIMATVNGPEDNRKLLPVSISPTRVRVHNIIAGGYRDQQIMHMASHGPSSEYLCCCRSSGLVRRSHVVW